MPSNSGQSKNMWKSAPAREEDGIPIFSQENEYIENYKKIANDHVKAMRPGVDNPFIENNLWKRLDESTRALVASNVAEHSKILDVGVGLGRVLSPLKQFERYGIDISLDYLRIAKEAGIDVAFSSIEDMPYKDGVFDAVIACDVLEHVLDLNECCRQMLRVLRPGGLLFLRVPYREDLSPYLDERLPYKFIHLRSFDLASLRLHFCKIFDCDYVEHLYSVPYLQGAPRLKLRLMSAQDAIDTVLTSTEQGSAVLELLRRATAVREEEFVAWIYDLREKDPTLYSKVEPYIVYPMDINVVFRRHV